jgi:hypothetical protein
MRPLQRSLACFARTAKPNNNLPDFNLNDQALLLTIRHALTVPPSAMASQSLKNMPTVASISTPLFMTMRPWPCVLLHTRAWSSTPEIYTVAMGQAS